MKQNNLIQLSLVFTIFLTLFWPSYNNLSVKFEQPEIREEFISNGNSDSKYPSVNLLFQYSSLSEKSTFQKVLNFFNPSSLHFYRNFPVGFVTLSQNNLQNLFRLYPDLYPKFQHSQIAQVLPSIDNLSPHALDEIQQLNYIPPPFIIGAPTLWGNGIDGSNSKIAIIDSGIDSTHADFDNRVVYQKSFVSEAFGFDSEEDPQDFHGHGTHVAGIAAGAGTSFRGIAYNADLYNLKVVDAAGAATQEAVLEAIDEAITQEVHVISISLGFSTSSPWDSDDVLTLAIDKAVDLGISVVTSAGNEGSEGNFASITSPASSHKGISVGATNGSNNVVSFSSRGPTFDFKVDPDIVAPGYQIVAPLASGCILELAYESIVGIELDDYIVLSGTSMAAPVVSGAIALLKQQFREASPFAIRAALQESASYMEAESLYEQGSGLINVGNAALLLEGSKEDTVFNIISTLPRANTEKPIELFERISFPGDSTQISVSFVIGKAGTITWDISETIQDFVELDTTPISLSYSGYVNSLINVSIPLSTIPGEYFGNLSYKFDNKTYFIPFEFIIKAPKANIYLYSHTPHSDDSEFYNYRSLGELLSKYKIDLNEFSETITWENLSKSDILLITDLEYPLSSQEINYISQFHKNNGSILLVTSAFPYFNPDPYIQITNMLNIPISFSERINIINFTDDGRDRIPIPIHGYNLSWEQNNSLIEGVNQLDLSFGTGFKVDNKQIGLRHLIKVQSNNSDDYYAVAGFEPNNKGKILVFGNENWLYHPSILSTDISRFLMNSFNWLVPRYDLAIQSHISTLHSLETFIYTSSNVTSLNADIKFKNGSSLISIPLIFNNATERYNLTLSLGNEDNEEILITVNNGSIRLKQFTVLDMSLSDLPEINDIKVDFLSSNEIYLPSWIDESDYDYVIDQGLDISLLHDSSSRINSLFIVSNAIENTLDIIYPPINRVTYFLEEIPLFNISNTEQILNWIVPEDLATGFYHFEVQIWYELSSENNYSVLLLSKKDEFIISDPEPTFYIGSTIRGLSLDHYRDVETSTDISYWSPGERVELNIIGDDDNSDEFEVYVQLINYYFWLSDRLVLDYFEILPSLENKSENKGIFRVPDSPIPLPNEEDLYIEINDQIFILLLFIRDKQGNFAIEVIFFGVSMSLGIDPFTLFIFLIFGSIISLGFIIIVRRRTKPKYPIYSLKERYPYVSNLKSGLKYCIYCGSEIIEGAKFCGSCGKMLHEMKTEY